MNDPAFTARFDGPVGMAVDSAGAVFVADHVHEIGRLLAHPSGGATRALQTTLAAKRQQALEPAGLCGRSPAPWSYMRRNGAARSRRTLDSLRCSRCFRRPAQGRSEGFRAPRDAARCRVACAGGTQAQAGPSQRRDSARRRTAPRSRWAGRLAPHGATEARGVPASRLGDSRHLRPAWFLTVRPTGPDPCGTRTTQRLRGDNSTSFSHGQRFGGHYSKLAWENRDRTCVLLTVTVPVAQVALLADLAQDADRLPTDRPAIGATPGTRSVPALLGPDRRYLPVWLFGGVVLTIR